VKLLGLFSAFCLSLLLFAACNPTKRLTEHEYLLNSNTIDTEDPQLTDELIPLIKQKPNRKIMAGTLRFHLFMYNLSAKKAEGREKGFYHWINTTIGEPPVVFDSTYIKKSVEQLGFYVNNKGFFGAQIQSTIQQKRKRQIDVIYTIHTGLPYRFSDIQYQSTDGQISNIINSEKAHSLLQKGKNYNVANIQKERERLTNLMRNNGYYGFSKEYISFKVDTNIGSRQVDVVVNISRINENGDSSQIAENHQVYSVGDIMVQTDYNPRNFDNYLATDTMKYNGIQFFNAAEKSFVRPQILSSAIYFKKGDLYRFKNFEETHKRLSAFGVFRFINIKFEERVDSSGKYLIDPYIQLMPASRHSFTIEAEGTQNNDKYLGIAGNIAYRNNNLFRGAELLEVKMKGALDAQKIVDSLVNPGDPFFNTVEISPEVSLSFQKLLLPFKTTKLLNPYTSIVTAYNFQRRPDYMRVITNISFSYNFKSSPNQRFIVTPLEFNAVKVNLSQAFLQKLIDYNDLNLQNSYSPHIVSAGKVSWIYNNQGADKMKDFLFVRFNIEVAGISLYLINSIDNQANNDKRDYLLFDLPYSRYVKPDIDARYYQVIDDHNSLVFRLSGGVGLPYGNTGNQVLPFEKSFFAGGSNGIRAWTARSLGPGSYKNTTGFEQMGDVKIESNIEYRGDIFKYIQGAVFVDAGNVWTRFPDSQRPGAEFKLDRFVSQIAVGAGMGIRLNLSFFIVRLDAAVPIKDPSKAPGNRWSANNKTVYNFGIGYPF